MAYINTASEGRKVRLADLPLLQSDVWADDSPASGRAGSEAEIRVWQDALALGRHDFYLKIKHFRKPWPSVSVLYKGRRGSRRRARGEFVEVASWLVLLRSRSLLPALGPEGPTPREELRCAVLDHATLAATTEFLRGREENPRHGSGGAPIGRRDTLLEQPAAEDPTLEDVLDAARQALEAARASASLENVDPKSSSVVFHLRWVVDTLGALPPGTVVSTEAWFTAQPHGQASAALFLALLELARQGILLLHQAKEFTTIHLKTAGPIPTDVEVPDLEAEQKCAVAG